MLANVSKGAPGAQRSKIHFRAIIEYITQGLSQDEVAEHVQELSGELTEKVIAIDTQRVLSVRSAAHEMRDTALQATDLRSRAVYHFVVSWPADEPPTAQQAIEAAKDVLSKVGLGEHQAVFAVHDNEPNRHVHVVANRVHPITHKINPIKNDFLKLSDACRTIEIEKGWSHDMGVSMVVQRGDEKQVVHAADIQRSDTVLARVDRGDLVTMVEAIAKKHGGKTPEAVIESSRRREKSWRCEMSHSQKRRGLETVTIATATLEKDFQNDGGRYVSQGGAGSDGRYQSVEKKIADGMPFLDCPEVQLRDGRLQIIDGRHTFAVARDQKHIVMRIAVTKRDAEAMRDAKLLVDVPQSQNKLRIDGVVHRMRFLEEHARLRNINRFVGQRHEHPAVLEREQRQADRSTPREANAFALEMADRIAAIRTRPKLDAPAGAEVATEKNQEMPAYLRVALDKIHQRVEEEKARRAAFIGPLQPEIIVENENVPPRSDELTVEGRKLRYTIDKLNFRTYFWADAPKVPLFVLKKHKIHINLSNCDDKAILAAMRLGQRTWGDIALTGDKAFKERAMGIAKSHNLQVRWRREKAIEMKQGQQKGRALSL